MTDPMVHDEADRNKAIEAEAVRRYGLIGSTVHGPSYRGFISGAQWAAGLLVPASPTPRDDERALEFNWLSKDTIPFVEWFDTYEDAQLFGPPGNAPAWIICRPKGQAVE